MALALDWRTALLRPRAPEETGRGCTDPRPRGERDGGQEHRDGAGRQQQLPGLTVDQAGVEPFAAQDEREFADLRQREPRHDRHAHRLAQDQEHERRQHRLAGDDREDEHGEGPEASGHRGQVHDHAERDEEQAGQQIANRPDLGVGLVTELGLGEHQPAEERPDGRRQPEEGAHPGGSDTGDQQREGKDLAPARADDGPQHRRQQQPPDHPDRDERDGGARDQRRDGLESHLTGEHRHEQQRDDDREILEEENADGEPAVRGVHLVSLAEAADDDRRAGHRHEHAQQHGRRRGAEAGRDHDGGHDRRGARHLQRSAGNDGPPDAAQLGAGELESDREEEQIHPDFREVLEMLGVSHQAQTGRAGHQSGQNQGDHRRHPQSAEQDDQDEADGVDGEQFLDQETGVHDGIITCEAPLVA